MKETVFHINAKYIGPTIVAFSEGKTYKAVGYDTSMKLVSVVDESNENYLYSPEAFEFTENFKELPSDFSDVYQNNGILELLND